MDVLVNSVSLVTLAEIGDKTQLLSILLAARFRTFWPICLGILCATTFNHALAAYAGHNLSKIIDPDYVSLGSGVLFILIGLWVLIPDKEPETQEPKYGAFLTALIAFFVAEMGDKTQLATITLGAKYSNILMVTIGTTLGMMIANIPAILFGEKLMKMIPLKVFRITACVLFVGFGAISLLYR